MKSRVLHGHFAASVSSCLSSSTSRTHQYRVSLAYAQTPSEDSPNLRIHPSISLDMPKEQPFPAAPEEVDIVEVERHRIEVLR